MKFQFKIQQYQTDAVDAVVQVFNGRWDQKQMVNENSKNRALVK